MSIRQLARILLVLLDVIVLVGSGVYLILYLYRWEWNRALVSGLFFLIAEVVLFAIVILGRLARMERRVVHLDEDHAAARAGWTVDPVPAASWRRDEPERGSPFAWLSEGDAVFVPVLLGLGAILSAVAYVVEHVASATAPERSHPLESRLSTLEAPEGPLVPVGADRLRIDDDVERRQPAGRGRRATSSAVALVVTALLVTAIVNTLAGLTQNRPDPELVGMVSTVTLEVHVRDEDAGVPAATVADALWVSCRGTLPDEVSATRVSTDGRLVSMRLDPAVARNAKRRFVGCLQDLTLEGALARVMAFDNGPAT